jgi:hypothetical protein
MVHAVKTKLVNSDILQSVINAAVIQESYAKLPYAYYKDKAPFSKSADINALQKNFIASVTCASKDSCTQTLKGNTSKILMSNKIYSEDVNIKRSHKQAIINKAKEEASKANMICLKIINQGNSHLAASVSNINNAQVTKQKHIFDYCKKQPLELKYVVKNHFVDLDTDIEDTDEGEIPSRKTYYHNTNADTGIEVEEYTNIGQIAYESSLPNYTFGAIQQQTPLPEAKDNNYYTFGDNQQPTSLALVGEKSLLPP